MPTQGTEIPPLSPFSHKSLSWSSLFSNLGRIRRPFLVGLACLAAAGNRGWAADAPSSPTQTELHISDLRQLVLDQNEAIQMKLLEAEVSERLYKGEKGIFEPALVGGVDYIDTLRPNNRQQTAQLGFFARDAFLEQNTLYNAGVEFLLGTGTKLRTGYVLRELDNNIGAPQTNSLQLVGKQYETFVGVNLTQPLLKNFGPRATMAKLRLASMASKIAFQEYRRQVLLILASAEAAYWDLRLAQEQVRLNSDSEATARKVLADNQARLDVGKSSELEVVQAQAGLAFRRARLDQARQTAFDYANRLSGLYSQKMTPGAPLPRAADAPELVNDPLIPTECYAQAFQKNPDFLIRNQQVAQENLRVAYTKNQRLPQLDLKASYGLNGLGTSVGESLDNWGTTDYPAWSVGVELRVPLAGGIKERNDLQAARLSKMRALTGLKEAETQIYNSIDAAVRKIELHRSSLTNSLSVVDFHEKLLKAQLDRLAVGSVDSRTVLETEEKLFEARVAVVESMVMERKSRVELEVVRGTLLEARNAEVDLVSLRRRTEEQIRSAKIDRQAVEKYQQQAVKDFTPAGTSRQ